MEDATDVNDKAPVAERCLSARAAGELVDGPAGRAHAPRDVNCDLEAGHAGMHLHMCAPGVALCGWDDSPNDVARPRLRLAAPTPEAGGDEEIPAEF